MNTENPVAMGWASRACGPHKWHFFRSRRSLCGKWEQHTLPMRPRVQNPRVFQWTPARGRLSMTDEAPAYSQCLACHRRACTLLAVVAL